MFKNKNLSFVNKLFLSLLLFSMIFLILLQSYMWNITESVLYKNLGEKAQVQAKELSVIPNLIRYVAENDTQNIAKLVGPIFAQSDASFIVIGNAKTQRLFHTSNKLLYEPMVGGDNNNVLNGNSVISVSEGSLGSSLRGKSPILDENKNVIGIVSVGYMIDDINALHKDQISPFIFFCFLLFIALFIFSWLFAKAIKKQMFNLEPKEIALLVKSQKSIMQSIYEGIIAIDLNYKITNINQSAKDILDIRPDFQHLIGKSLNEYIKSLDFIYSDNNKHDDLHDHICYFNDVIVIASRIRILIDNELQGWVISFRGFEDINLLSTQLTQVKQYADNLRTLRHEHLNWMATLSGLIYMKRYDEAEKFIQLHSSDNQKSLDFIAQRFTNPTICGLLIGKYAQAHEKGIKLIFDPANQLRELPSNITEIEFMSILGNLLDNAFKASLKNPLGSQIVSLFLSDATDEIVLEVSDQGCGVDSRIRNTLFEPGITTENPKEHGIGLHLVATYTKKANGYITFDDNQPYGSIFSVFIPKNN